MEQTPTKKMGPDRNTPKWHEQVERVLIAMRNVEPKDREERGQLMLMYVLDTSYARCAILEAERKYKIEKGIHGFD